MTYYLASSDFEITGQVWYKAVVYDSHSNDVDMSWGSFETPEEALAAAKESAESHRKSHISYWVEYDLDLAVPGYEGLT